MLRQEEIQLKSHRKGTLIKYFTTYTGQTSEDGKVSFLIDNPYAIGYTVVDSLSDTFYKRDSRNIFVPSNNSTIFTGTTVIQTTEAISQITQNKISNKYISEIQQKWVLDVGFNTGNTPQPMSYVEFQEIELNDMFVNIQLKRTTDTLDTLNIYNTPIGSQITQESDTGVVFGRLVAQQNILDENGEKHIIPLKNTVIGIFNPSTEFPNVASTDDNGNRLTLNIKENISIGSYFNNESYITDFKFLTDTSNVKNIPSKYKYTTITNDNGEFILHNIPVGEQTLMFEVNLLKQGLTSDEVALNYFPYPLEESPNVDKIPHYFFRQIPVNVLPVWGSTQTGYTEINIKAQIDLRKWVTYYLCPIAYKNKTIEEMQADGIFSKLTCAIRDMTKTLDVNARPTVEVVEIQDVYDRNFEQVTEWLNEFKTKKNKVEFLSTRYNVFKLPANLYDPLGINSKGEKGVWLNAYQFKMYYGNKDSAYKATGFERDWIPNFGAACKNHFDLSKNADPGSLYPVGKLGVFPYEKPWTINYPQPYKITKIPSIQNPNKTYDATGAPLEVTEPVYLDGDLVGAFIPYSESAAGYGLQDISGDLVDNKFSREVTKVGVYKYETVDQWDEQYSNGFTPILDNPVRNNNGLPESNVVDGELWQRLEAGFGYWLKPEGWPRIINHAWGDSIINSDHIKGLTPPPKFGPGSYADGIYKRREDILMRFDASMPYYKFGGLDIYRIVNPKEVLEPLVPPVEKFVKIWVQDLISEGRRPTEPPAWLTVGTYNHSQFNQVNQADLIIQNLGTNRVEISLGSDIQNIEPGGSFHFEKCISPQSTFILPANSDYDSSTNSYKKAKYKITFVAVVTDRTNGGPHDPGLGDIGYGGVIECNLPADIETEIPNYFLVTVVPTIVSMASNTGAPPYNSTITLAIGKYVAINGFPYCVWRGSFPFANQSNWVATYFPGYPVYTPNPVMLLSPLPMAATALTGNGGNYPYGLL